MPRPPTIDVASATRTGIGDDDSAGVGVGGELRRFGQHNAQGQTQRGCGHSRVAVLGLGTADGQLQAQLTLSWVVCPADW